ncbi:MAG TPA: ABC transporter permease [Vicinamibacterales bacterium]|jgi:predicted permease
MGWTRFLRRGRWDAERALELEAHLAIETDENIARGMAPDEARCAAHRKLGNVLRIREDIYRMNTIASLDALWRDLRYGVRLLRRTPGFTAVAVLSLTLGIGANAAIFQVIDAVRLRVLPVGQPQELVEVRIATPRSRAGNFYGSYAELTNPQWEQIRARQQAFTGVLAWGAERFDLARGGEVRKAHGLYVSGSFFEVLGVPAARGRVFNDADDRPGCAGAGAVISHAFWQREYGGEDGVLGRKVQLAGHPFDIIGVTPPTFHGVEVGRSYDVAVPICAAAVLEPDAGMIEQSHVWWLSAMGRLRPAWTSERATAHLRAISPSLFQRTLSAWFDPEQAKDYLAFKLEAVSCSAGFSSLRADYGTPLWLLFALSGVVLLASCVNLANLMLARAGTREREVGVRLATGASRWRVVRQLLTESVLLAAIGTASGLLLAHGLSGLLVASLSTAQDPVFMDLSMDWRVLGFAIAMVMVTALAFGLTPALRATATPVHRMMKAGGRGASIDRGRHGLQGTLVVVQVALSMVMVGSAVLFALSLRNLATFDTGHRVDGVLAAELSLGRLGVPNDRLPALHRTLIERLRAVPGIESVARTAIVPMAGMQMNDTIRVVRGTSTTQRDTSFHRVGTGYFRTMGLSFVSGRDFDDHDDTRSKPVAIVNRTFAARFLSPATAVGGSFEIQTTPGHWMPYEIVGVVKDAVYSDVRDPVPPVAYLALDQDAEPDRDARLLIHSRLPPTVLRSAVGRAIAEVGPAISIEFSTLSEIVRHATQRERMLAALSASFGILAMALSAIGIYGVLSYLVVRRRQEIGVRLALGATRLAIVQMVARESLGWLGAGIALGAVLAGLAATAARSLLFGLTPTDPTAMVVAGALLTMTGVVATIVPAVRAARLHAAGALREE